MPLLLVIVKSSVEAARRKHSGLNVKLQNWNFYSFCLQNFWHENSINLSSQYVANYFCFYFPSLYSLCFSLHKCKQFAKASVTNNLDDALFSGFFFDRSEY